MLLQKSSTERMGHQNSTHDEPLGMPPSEPQGLPEGLEPTQKLSEASNHRSSSGHHIRRETDALNRFANLDSSRCSQSGAEAFRIECPPKRVKRSCHSFMEPVILQRHSVWGREGARTSRGLRVALALLLLDDNPASSASGTNACNLVPLRRVLGRSDDVLLSLGRLLARRRATVSVFSPAPR